MGDTTEERYPDGKLNAQDDGVIDVRIGVEDGRVVLAFPKPVTWFALPPDLARKLIVLIDKRASEADGHDTLVMEHHRLLRRIADLELELVTMQTERSVVLEHVAKLAQELREDWRATAERMTAALAKEPP